jgi:hypothetical protein
MEKIMKVMVFDVPAEDGGALSVLKDFYHEVVNHEDKSIQWIFILSKPMFCETENVKIIRFPWIKKSWIHRLYFDQVIAPKLVKKMRPERVFSLQNVTIPRVRVNQIIYVHQSLPFVKYKFSFKDNKVFWIYQNIISKVIYKSIKKSQKVIVQTNWFKESCIEKTGVCDNKLKVVPPTVNVNIKNYFLTSENHLSTFFYPAGPSFYKNHRVIIEACERLKREGVIGHKVIFTLNGNETDHIANLYKIVKEKMLPIEFIGNIDREKVFEWYSKSILIFPSYIETYGLPMLESKLTKGIIFAGDTPFAHEILDGYGNAYFFDVFHGEQLSRLMKEAINKKLTYYDQFFCGVNTEKEIPTLVDQVLN